MRQGFRKSASVPPVRGEVSNDSAGVPPVRGEVSKDSAGVPPVRGEASESEKHTRTNSMKKTEKTRTFEPEFKQ